MKMAKAVDGGRRNCRAVSLTVHYTRSLSQISMAMDVRTSWRTSRKNCCHKAARTRAGSFGKISAAASSPNELFSIKSSVAMSCRSATWMAMVTSTSVPSRGACAVGMATSERCTSIFWRIFRKRPSRDGSEQVRPLEFPVALPGDWPLAFVMHSMAPYLRRDTVMVQPWTETCGQIRPLIEETDGAAVEVHHLEIIDAKLHYHQRTDEIYYIIDGHGKMRLDDEEIELHEGVVVSVSRRG